MPTRALTLLTLCTLLLASGLSACAPSGLTRSADDARTQAERPPVDQAYVEELLSIPAADLTPEQVAYLHYAAEQQTAENTRRIGSIMAISLGVVVLAAAGGIGAVAASSE